MIQSASVKPPLYPHLQHLPMKILANLETLQMLLSVTIEATNYVTNPNWSLQNVCNILKVEKQFKSSGMWFCVARWAVPNVWTECSPFTFEGEAVLALLDPEDKGTINLLWNIRNHPHINTVSAPTGLNSQQHQLSQQWKDYCNGGHIFSKRVPSSSKHCGGQATC